MLRTLSVAAAVAVASGTPALQGHSSSNLRVGVYVGGGISPASAGGYVAAGLALAQQGVVASSVNFTDADVEALTLRSASPIDVLIVLGGYSPNEGTAMTPTGLNAIRTFVPAVAATCRRALSSSPTSRAVCCHTAWSVLAGGGVYLSKTASRALKPSWEAVKRGRSRCRRPRTTAARTASAARTHR